MEALAYPPSDKQRAAFGVISDLSTVLVPLGSKYHIEGQKIKNFFPPDILELCFRVKCRGHILSAIQSAFV